ncbi:MAG: c-type cytochrome [Bryobacteraceae bacterium]
MRLLIISLLAAAVANAQDVFEQGAKVFQTTCAQGYCHGSGGTQGRAPKLIGRVYEGAAALKIIRDGVPNTGMPGFADRLNSAQLNAVTAYVVKISGGDASHLGAAMGAASAREEMPTDARKGKELFHDAVRGVKRCNTCHTVEGFGIAIGPNLASGGAHDAAAIRNGKPATIRMATVGSDRFPALVVEQQGDWRKVYDLSAIPPVLRTLNKSEVTFSGDSTWRHAKVVENYNDDELRAIAAYLRWVAR